MNYVLGLLGSVFIMWVLFFVVVCLTVFIIIRFIKLFDNNKNIQNFQTKNENWDYSTNFIGIDKDKIFTIWNRNGRCCLGISLLKDQFQLIFYITESNLLFSYEHHILWDGEKCTGRIKFDSSPSIIFTGNKPVNGSINYIYFDDSYNLIQKIKNSKRITIEVQRYKKNSLLQEFNVENLNLDYLKK